MFPAPERIITHHTKFDENSFPYETKSQDQTLTSDCQVTPTAVQFFDDESDSESQIETNLMNSKSSTDEVTEDFDLPDPVTDGSDTLVEGNGNSENTD